jgi:hypothetical protein
VDRLYTFFSASTHRWNLLKEVLDQQNLPCVKQRSDTRWSADASAVASLSCGYKEIRSVLQQIAESLNEKPETKCDARGLANVIKLLETGIMTGLWQTILLRFNKISVALQSSTIGLRIGVSLLSSLEEFVISLRENFHQFEETSKLRSGNQNNKGDGKRKIQRNKLWDTGNAENTPILCTTQKFKVSVFLVVLDQLLSGMEKRISAYATVNHRFGFLDKLIELSNDAIYTSVVALQTVYLRDLEHEVCKNNVDLNMDSLHTSCMLFCKRMTSLLPSLMLKLLYAFISHKLQWRTFFFKARESEKSPARHNGPSPPQLPFPIIY